jgi:hypothetical protein
MTNQKRLEAVAKAEDTRGLLDDIAWNEVLKPALQKRQADISKALMTMVLGGVAPNNLTKEQLAGMMYGIDEIIRVIEKILKDGEKALREIESQGVHLALGA